MIRHFNGYVLFPLLERASKRKILPKLAELKRFENINRRSQLEIQKEEFYKFLTFCKSEVPFYRDLFKKQSFIPEKILSDIRYLMELPPLTKDIIRENVNRLRMPTAHHVRKTGGSTGQSVHFYYDNHGLDWTSAINLQAYDMAKNFRHKKDCHISSELGLKPPTKKDLLFDKLKLFSQNRKKLMIESFSDKDLEWSYLNLKRIKPYLLQGHPSTAFAIAEYIERQEYPKQKYCTIFEPSGEMLTPKIVDSIEKNLGAKVVNRYGNAEFGVMAHSRLTEPYNKLKVFERAFFIEECHSDKLIVSNCTNFGMPLLRYETGDIGTVISQPDGVFIHDIQGRIHDTVLINNISYATHYLMDYFDHKITGVREFQIVLKTEELPVLNIVPERSIDIPRIKNMIKDRWPTGLVINFLKFEELERVGWRQKFRHIIDKRGEK